MVKQTSFTAKHIDATIDYKQAYDIVNTIEIGAGITVTTINDKAFRKYLYDLSLKNNKEFATRKRGENMRYITRIS